MSRQRGFVVEVVLFVLKATRTWIGDQEAHKGLHLSCRELGCVRIDLVTLAEGENPD